MWSNTPKPYLMRLILHWWQRTGALFGLMKRFILGIEPVTPSLCVCVQSCWLRQSFSPQKTVGKPQKAKKQDITLDSSNPTQGHTCTAVTSQRRPLPGPGTLAPPLPLMFNRPTPSHVDGDILSSIKNSSLMFLHRRDDTQRSTKRWIHPPPKIKPENKKKPKETLKETTNGTRRPLRQRGATNKSHS